MSKIIKIRKGLNIPIKGVISDNVLTPTLPETFGLKPTDFYGIVPKLKIKLNDKIKAGDTVFYDKNNPKIVFSSPVSGTIIAINRGERRKILEVVIERDRTIIYKQFEKQDPERLTRDTIINKLLESGIFPLILQRPYNIIADPDALPQAIFISSFDTSPLAPDNEIALKGNEPYFRTGIKALSKLTKGEIHIGVKDTAPENTLFRNIKNTHVHTFSGPHPTGNVGIQIHHIAPINKGDIIWTLKPQDIVIIGKLFEEGIYDATRTVGLCGSEVKKTAYYKTLIGASIKNMIKDNISEKKLRYISGNVLTGTKIDANSYLGFYDTQLTVIPEGDEYEMIGWAKPGIDKYSASRTFLSKLVPKKTYDLNANMNGGERAFVMSCQYDKVLPMDILPEQLIKSILVKDIDLMEKLGIYEIAEEDLALCEYICTSKIKVQEIIREGFNLMIKELN